MASVLAAVYTLVARHEVSGLWLFVHDEIIVQAPEHDAERTRSLLERGMTSTFRGLPIVADAKILGPAWGQHDPAAPAPGHVRNLRNLRNLPAEPPEPEPPPQVPEVPEPWQPAGTVRTPADLRKFRRFPQVPDLQQKDKPAPPRRTAASQFRRGRQPPKETHGNRRPYPAYS